VRQLGTLARRLRIHWIDVVIAASLSALTVVEGSGRDSMSFSPAVLLCTIPLVVRRRWPIPVVLVVFAGFGLAGDTTNLAALLGGEIAVVSVGLYSQRQNLAGLVVLGAAAFIALEFGRGSTSTLPVPGAVLAFLLIGAAYLAGREIGTRQKQLRQERERAAQREHEQEVALRAATETERRHIARELHDVVAHSVSVMVVQAGAARQVLTDKPEAARESLLAVEASGHEAMNELRRLLGVLSENGSDPPPLAPQPGMGSVEGLIARVKDAGLPVELQIEGQRTPLPAGLDVAAYRIVQEALTNALKYAGGARTQVVVRYLPEAIDLEVVDEGTVSAPADGIGRGLAGMRERVALFSGTIETGPQPGRGYAVRAHLPIDLPS
jgi:signal transduction histidine kinase